MGILIIDDAEDTRLYLQAVLASDGFEVYATASAQEALAHLQDRPSIDLILLDVIMPGIDGIELCQQIKSDAAWRDVPVIMVTALTNIEDLDRAFAAGAMDYIMKPVKKRELLARIRSALALKTEMDRRKEREEELLRVTAELEEAVRKLQNLSSLDGLTGLANRRRFDEYLASEWKRAIRNGTPISLILFDIDWFKPYNDTYGHIQGDDCLKAIASLMPKVVRRSSDLVCRYGGEEFAVILPDTSQEGALAVAESIREALSEAGIEHRQSPLDRVTVSVGVATAYPSPSSEPVTLIGYADEALYEAKRQGRNRTVENAEIHRSR
ncbi:two component diguanylate cyclase [Heliomicrobium modesticaldum Ice1]|uniref:Stage 0 sporulation protein A homolog n=1 Tax=Heliobacterium modesticaldum (strain ATCC 51547 / Ice1) TaxID=498761 RepID=B0TG17_HELMI|nr:diguanylate cyclase [Heliomicrobium modesticaldum]ABZ83174.1 two component diguanylate cyclase [Heliomicrobium modesticaldum Ice1]